MDEAVAAYGAAAAEYFGSDGRPLQVYDHEEMLSNRTDLSSETIVNATPANARLG